MKMPKPTDADRARFSSLVPVAAGVEIKPMFGNLGAFVNGNMFMGLFGEQVGVKLPEKERTQLLAEPGAGPFGPEERPMGGYVTLPVEWSARKAKKWTEAALVTAAALPAKQPKVNTAKKTARKTAE